MGEEMKSFCELGKHLKTLWNIRWSPHPSGLFVSPEMLLMALIIIIIIIIIMISNVY